VGRMQGPRGYLAVRGRDFCGEILRACRRIFRAQSIDGKTERTPDNVTEQNAERTRCNEYDGSCPIGLRKVYPYYFTFTTFTKGRWVGEKILEVFAREFRAHPAEEYERCIRAGTLTVNYQKVDVDYRLRHNDLLANVVHRSAVGVRDAQRHDATSSDISRSYLRYRNNYVTRVLHKDGIQILWGGVGRSNITEPTVNCYDSRTIAEMDGKDRDLKVRQAGRDASFSVAIFQLMSRCSWYSRSMVQNSLSKGSLEKTRGRDECRVRSLLAFIPGSFLGIVPVYLRCYERSLASFPVMREIRWDDSISRKSPSVGERFALPSTPCNFAGELVPVDASANGLYIIIQCDERRKQVILLEFYSRLSNGYFEKNVWLDGSEDSNYINQNSSSLNINLRKMSGIAHPWTQSMEIHPRSANDKAGHLRALCLRVADTRVKRRRRCPTSTTSVPIPSCTRSMLINQPVAGLPVAPSTRDTLLYRFCASPAIFAALPALVCKPLVSLKAPAPFRLICAKIE
ncbi:RNA pseudouridylate synthase domain-containing protein 2, partial [Trachymyrmex cornetzi]